MSITTCLALACAPSQEATRVERDVVLDSVALDDLTATDLGYTIRLDAARIAALDLEFTIQGEMHAAWRPWDLLVPRAIAHPGHYAGGDVTGALTGSFMFQWVRGVEPVHLGSAELLTGTYRGCNFGFRRADEVTGADPLAGHSAYLFGVASRDGEDYPFSAVFDLDDGAAVIGAPFEAEIDAAETGTLRLSLRARDDVTGAALFDGVEFADLAQDGGLVSIRPGDPAHNLVRRALQSHVFYAVEST